jgi:hypothetical protein
MDRDDSPRTYIVRAINRKLEPPGVEEDFPTAEAADAGEGPYSKKGPPFPKRAFSSHAKAALKFIQILVRETVPN